MLTTINASLNSFSYLANSESKTNNTPQKQDEVAAIAPPEAGSSRLSDAAYGAMMLPAQVVATITSLGIATILGYTDLATLKSGFYPTCANWNVPSDISLQIKALTIVMANINIPFEEFLCRYLLQDVLLKKTPQCVLSKVAPDYAHLVDSTQAKVARVIISAGVFSAMHLPNQAYLGLSDSQMNAQLFNTFALGLLTGILKEKTGRVWASVGLHAAWNSAVVAPYLRC